MTKANTVIDLTGEAATADSVATEPQRRPLKKLRTSLRIQNAKASSSESGDDDSSGKKDTALSVSVKSEPEPPTESNDSVVYGKKDYFEVEEILERRTKNYRGDTAAGGRNVVEYLVRWKNPPDYAGEGSLYEDSWQIAENLDPHSLAAAFRLFPMDGDPDRSNNEMEEQVESEEDDDELDFGGLCEEDDDVAEEDSDAEEEEETSNDEMDDGKYDAVEEDMDAQTRHDVAHLGESDYDSPGSVELELNRRTYRVSQSFISQEEDVLYTISMILPIQKKAKCLKYIKMKECFACPTGKEDMFIQLSEEVTLDLSLLRTYKPYTTPLKKFSMKYEESENQRSFCYRNETAKVLHHPTGKPTVLELFAGVGGMSLGLENAGFDVKWVVDSNSLALATHKANFSTNSVTNMNVYEEKVSSFLKNSKQEHDSVEEDYTYPQPGEVDHLHASPPCKGFSRANRTGGKDDMVNNEQTLLFVRAVHHFRPKTVTFENVAGLLAPNFKSYLKSVVASLLSMKYQLRVEVFNASSFGDPQHRRRLFILASRCDCILPSSPLPTHGFGEHLLPFKTCKDALQMFDVEPKRSTSIISLPNNNIKVWNHNAFRTAPNEDKDYTLEADEPSRTILASSRPHVHYNGSRFISVREAAALQSFPSTYRFFGSISAQYSQVGNAVPICLASAVSRSVIRVHGAP